MSRLTLALIILLSSVAVGVIFILLAPTSWPLWVKIPTVVVISVVIFWFSNVIDDNIRYHKRKQIQLKKNRDDF